MYKFHNYFTLLCNSAETIKKLFTKVDFSEAGSNERLKEEATYMLFMDFLRDCEGKLFLAVMTITLKSIFHQMVKSLVHHFNMYSVFSLELSVCLLSALHDMEAEMHFNLMSTFPTASTCALG